MTAFLEWLAPVWKPHPGQEKFLLNNAKTKILACGRRWGKTDVCAVQVISKLQSADPIRQLIVAPTLDQARILYKRVCSLIKRLIDRGLWDKFFDFLPIFRDSKMEVEIGYHTIAARSAKQKHHLRGDQADHIIVDEAAYLKGEVVNEILTPMMATTDGELTLISTPNGQDYFYDYFQTGIKTQADKDEYFSMQAPSGDNPHVIQKFLDRQKKILSPNSFATEYEAKFVQRDGYVFNRQAVEACVYEEPDAEIGGPTIIAIDWARYHDWSALVVLRGFQGRASILECDRLQRTGWRDQIEWVKSVLDRYPGARIICDTTGVGDGITTWLKEELRTVPIRYCVISAKSKPELVDGLVKSIELQSIQIPAYKPLLDELDNFEASRSSTGHVQLAAQCGHDDLVMALAIGVSDLPYAHRHIMTTKPR